MRQPSSRSTLLAGTAAAMAAVPLVALPAAAVPGSDSTVFINEIHYDNDGTDTGELVEVAGPAGTDLSGWSVVLYNGANGAVYDTDALSGTLTNQQGGYGTVAVEYPSNGVQNGAPDGVALVGPAGLVQFLSYEGTMTAASGPAAGQTSTDIGVAQGASTPVGSSLSLTGSGTTYGDFSWTVTDGGATPGAVNTGQTLGDGSGGDPDPDPDPEPDPECGDPATLIHQIQGSGATFDPAFGGTRSVEGVVTAAKPGLSGFYVQEEDDDADADATTSEGIFVFGSDLLDGLEPGQVVRVTGTVGEYTTSGGASQTQLRDAVLDQCADLTGTVTPTAVTFPLADRSDLEHSEGMLVELTDTLVISEYFNYDRFGEVVLAKPLDGQDRLHTPTAVVDPGAPAQELAEEQARRIITLDDDNSSQNPAVIPHPGNGEPFGPDNSFRGGDTVTGVQGVIDHTFGLYRIQPTEYGDYAAVNERPTSAPEVGGSVTVASANVLNYFLTIDDGRNDVCGANQDQECRGADSAAELERQRAKTIAQLAELDADVVGLMEMENTPGVEPAADLVAGLNDVLGAGTYDYVDTGVIGTDAIRLGLLYKPGVVRPAGDFAVLDSSVDPRFVDTANRPMLTQTFDEVATGARFTVSVNHLKSKGSACAGDPDTGDGQGNCNQTRVAAAEAIADFLAGDPTGSGDPDHLVIGDLNSYDHEDPIRALESAGYTDEIERFGGEYAYGYVFDGKVGYLDHALSSASLTSQVTGAAEWHVNADEPDALDYNLDFGRPADWYEPNLYRASDHDPVLVGLDLTPASAGQCYADDAQTVASFDQGARVNGTGVPRGFSDADQALGTSGPRSRLVSLGLGGELVLEFSRPVQNTNGDAADLRVVAGDERAKDRADAAVVSASFDGETWVELGRVTGTTELDLGSLSAARYVRVVDDTTGPGTLPSTDGFDLDAVEVLTGCV
ncbi:ExeM/NucH family extracellular endonuclease [Thalassiella azotivora]